MFTEEEKRYIKYELGLDINFANPSNGELMEITIEAADDVEHPSLRDAILSKIENSMENIQNG